MEFQQVINNRESIRSYDPGRPINKEVLIRILEAGRLAPSAANRQPWKFLIISTKEMLSKVKPCYEKTWFQDAPHILAVVGNEQEAWVRGCDHRCFIETDITIALDYMILAAVNEGVATCWISNFKPDVLRAALNLKEHECIFSITPLGYPRPDFIRKGVKERKPFDAVVEWK